MRITFVLHVLNLSGGVRVVAIYADRLRRRGHEVAVVARAPLVPPLSTRMRLLLSGQGWIRRPDWGSHLDEMGIPCTTVDTRGPILARHVPDADVIVATWWETAHWVHAMPASKGAKAFFIQHHEAFEGQPLERVRAAWRLPLHKITIAKWLVDLAAEEYGDRDCTLVHNSVETDRFFAPPRARNSVPTVGLMYSPNPIKGCRESFAAFERARARIPSLRMIAFGALPPVPELPLPEGTEYHVRPEQERLRELYASCDVWLCGSYSEGFHLPPLEAMACRTPVVSTRVGGAVETVEQGINGFLADTGDVDQLADGLVRLLSLPAEGWLRFSEAAWRRAHSYTWDDATDRFLEGLRAAMRKEGRPLPVEP